MAISCDCTFELNAYGKPKINSPIEADKNILMTILFSRKGTYPSLPDIGLDIRDLLYSHYDEINVNDLKKNIINQCSALGEYIENGNIQIQKLYYRNQPSLLISVSGDTIYPDSYINDNNKKKFMIGLTFDELNNLLCNINEDDS